MLVSILTTLGVFVAFFSLFDSVGKKEHLKIVSGYIFSSKGASGADFEKATISILLHPFIRRSKVSLVSVFGLSSLGLILTSLAFDAVTRVQGAPADPSFYAQVMSTWLGPTVVLISFPFDYWSLWVSKKLFSDRQPTGVKAWTSALLDLLFSVIPTSLPFFITVYLIYNYPDWLEDRTVSQALAGLAVASVFNVGTSILITLVQIITLFFGQIIRLFSQLLLTLNVISRMTEFEKHPFKFIGLIVGIIVCVVEQVAT